MVAQVGVKGLNVKKFVIRQGSVAEMLKKRGVRVIEFGKPNVAIYNFAFDTLSKRGIDISDKSRICMIGDTLSTDIKGANNAGIKSVLCVETGYTAHQISNGHTLEGLIKHEGVVVDYMIRGIGVNYGCAG